MLFLPRGSIVGGWGLIILLLRLVKSPAPAVYISEDLAVIFACLEIDLECACLTDADFRKVLSIFRVLNGDRLRVLSRFVLDNNRRSRPRASLPHASFNRQYCRNYSFEFHISYIKKFQPKGAALGTPPHLCKAIKTVLCFFCKFRANLVGHIKLLFRFIMNAILLPECSIPTILT